MDYEDNRNSPSTGESVATLGPEGPVLVGDYWNDPGTVHVIDVLRDPPRTTSVNGTAAESCGADVAAADVDGDGATDVVSSCLRYGKATSRLRTYEGASGEWEALGWLEGTGPVTWFGRPTVGGFDLDRDGVGELAVGEQHTPYDPSNSLIHILPRPWRGHCTLNEVGAITLHNGFPPANLATGDLDGDGASELLATAQGMTAWSLSPEPLSGWVHVLREEPPSGVATGAGAWLTFEGVAPDEGFGSSVAVGDFNADGCADVAVGAELFDLSPRGIPGRVYVFDGPFDGGTLSAAEADTVLEGTAPRDKFGSEIAVGDFDGDGVDDLAVSAMEDHLALDWIEHVHPRPRDQRLRRSAGVDGPCGQNEVRNPHGEPIASIAVPVDRDQIVAEHVADVLPVDRGVRPPRDRTGRPTRRHRVADRPRGAPFGRGEVGRPGHADLALGSDRFPHLLDRPRRRTGITGRLRSAAQPAEEDHRCTPL